MRLFLYFCKQKQWDGLPRLAHAERGKSGQHRATMLPNGKWAARFNTRYRKKTAYGQG